MPALLLAVESATARASVALLRGDAIVAEREAPAGVPASETLLPTILSLLAEAGIGPSALDAFAVSVGPGSFTGLRVGVATVKGLAFDSGLPVLAVPTLAALAAQALPAPGAVAALLDARRDEVYAAIHVGDALAPPRLAPTVLGPRALADALAAAAPESLPSAIGEGVPIVAEALRARFGARVRLLGEPSAQPRAAWVGRLGARLLEAGTGIAAESLAPVYVRRAEAEVRRTGQPTEASPLAPGSPASTL